MSAAAFDTLKLAKRLAAAGMPPVQAEGLAEGLSEVMTTELATKSDLTDLRAWATAEFSAVRSEVRTEFAKVRLEIAQSKNETVRWMIGLFVAQTTLVLGAMLRLAA